MLLGARVGGAETFYQSILQASIWLGDSLVPAQKLVMEPLMLAVLLMVKWRWVV